MIDINKIWPFIISELIPGFVFYFDFYMVLDMMTSRTIGSTLSPMHLYGILFVFSVISGLSLSTISLFTFQKVSERMLKTALTADKENMIAIQTMFYNLIIPTIVAGCVWPKYFLIAGSQPWLFLASCVIALAFFCFGTIQISIGRTHNFIKGK